MHRKVVNLIRTMNITKISVQLAVRTCDHTKNPNNPILAMAKIILCPPKTGFLAYVDKTWLTIPKAGIIKI